MDKIYNLIYKFRKINLYFGRFVWSCWEKLYKNKNQRYNKFYHTTLGIAYGFPICCIKYWNSRLYENEPSKEWKYNYICDNLCYLMCPKCKEKENKDNEKLQKNV